MVLRKIWQKSLLAALCTAGCMLSPVAHAEELTIFYVPLDNSTVCDDYVRQTMEAEGS